MSRHEMLQASAGVILSDEEKVLQRYVVPASSGWGPSAMVHQEDGTVGSSRRSLRMRAGFRHV